MSTRAVRVLLVGESVEGFSFLLQHLKKRGCECWVATSNWDATRLSGGHAFDLVLCTNGMSGINALIASLMGSPASLFCSHPVEDSCWWLPAVQHGEKCLGTPALRPSEFANALDRMVNEIKSREYLSLSRSGEGPNCS
jgi:hypothetical protein